VESRDAKSRGNIKKQVPDNELAMLLLDLNDLDPIVVVEQITVPSQAHVLGIGGPEPNELCVAAFRLRPTNAPAVAQAAIQLQLSALDLPSRHIETEMRRVAKESQLSFEHFGVAASKKAAVVKRVPHSLEECVHHCEVLNETLRPRDEIPASNTKIGTWGLLDPVVQFPCR
jgi:hypothetical protein